MKTLITLCLIIYSSLIYAEKPKGGCSIMSNPIGYSNYSDEHDFSHCGSKAAENNNEYINYIYFAELAVKLIKERINISCNLKRARPQLQVKNQIALKECGKEINYSLSALNPVIQICSLDKLNKDLCELIEKTHKNIASLQATQNLHRNKVKMHSGTVWFK